MKRLLTFVCFVVCFLGAKADHIVDARVDFKDQTEVKFWSWGSESAQARLSIQNGCLHFASTEATDPTWDCQFVPIGTNNVEIGQTYTLKLKIKGDHAENLSAVGFGGSEAWGNLAVPTDWTELEIEYPNVTKTDGGVLIQCGGYVGTFDIEWMEISHEGKPERPAVWQELLVNGDAEKSWEELGLADVAFDDMENNMKVCFWTKEKGVNEHNPHPAEIVEVEGGHAFICRATLADTPKDGDADVSAWDNQIWIQSPRAWKTGETYKLSFRYKASEPVVTNTQVHHQTPSDYLFWQAIGDISFETEWKTYEGEVTVPADANGMWSIAFNLNPNVKTPVDFYVDDISWGEMVLDHGLFIAGKNADTGLDYDFDNAIEFVYDETEQAMAATIGEVGKQKTWVNEVMISTVRGNDRQFKANTYKVKGAVIEGIENWVDFDEGSNAVIKLPAQGVWTVYVDQEAMVMSFVELEGDTPREPIEIVPNETEVVVHGQERDWLPAKEDGTPQEEQVGEGQPWDNQFILMGNRPLKAGEVTIIEFDYVATVDANTNTQCGAFGNPGGYVFWNALGDVSFTTEEQHFTKTYTIPNDADGMGAFNFNMAVIKGACDYTIKNIKWYLEDMTESLIDMEGTKNFFVKEGAGTAPYEFGTDPDGIENVAVQNNKNTVVYNLAGQRVNNSFKGIAIKNGTKVVVK